MSLVDYKVKGHTVEYVGHDTVDGDDALRLKVTLKMETLFMTTSIRIRTWKSGSRGTIYPRISQRNLERARILQASCRVIILLHREGSKADQLPNKITVDR